MRNVKRCLPPGIRAHCAHGAVDVERARHRSARLNACMPIDDHVRDLAQQGVAVGCGSVEKDVAQRGVAQRCERFGSSVGRRLCCFGRIGHRGSEVQIEHGVVGMSVIVRFDQTRADRRLQICAVGDVGDGDGAQGVEHLARGNRYLHAAQFADDTLDRGQHRNSPDDRIML